MTTPDAQQSFEDAAEALAVAVGEEAIDRVEANAPEEWLDAVERIVRDDFVPGQSFTTDYIWARLADLAVDPPHEPRAMGAAIRRLKAGKVIRHTGTYVRSIRKEHHGGPVAVWVRT